MLFKVRASFLYRAAADTRAYALDRSFFHKILANETRLTNQILDLQLYTYMQYNDTIYKAVNAKRQRHMKEFRILSVPSTR